MVTESLEKDLEAPASEAPRQIAEAPPAEIASPAPTSAPAADEAPPPAERPEPVPLTRGRRAQQHAGPEAASIAASADNR